MSNTALQTQTQAAVQTTDCYEKADKYLRLVGQNIPEKDRVTFLELCREMRLDPFKRDVYCVPYRTKDGGYACNIITSYEVYLRRAEETKLLNGVKIWFEPVGNDIKCICRIKRKDWEEPFEHEVYMSEYYQDVKMWKEKPKTMLRKVAMSQAYRMCFPLELGGMPYTSDEMPSGCDTQTISTDDGAVEVYDEPQTNKKTLSLEEARRYTLDLLASKDVADREDLKKLIANCKTAEELHKICRQLKQNPDLQTQG